jgi:hypothetical protein
MVSLVVFYFLIFQFRGDDGQTITRLTNQLTQKNVDYRSLELRYNHIDLQNAALLKQVLSMRAEISRLEFEGAVAEDNLQFLQVETSPVDLHHCP